MLLSTFCFKSLKSMYFLRCVFLFCLSTPLLFAQQRMGFSADATPLLISLDDALQIAKAQSFAVRNNPLDKAEVRAQIDELVGGLLPNISFSTTYQRNVLAANPFAGSDAGNIFSGLGALDWIIYNENQRLNGAPTLTLAQFRQRQAQGLSDAGVNVSASSNPFAVPNQISGGLSITQSIYAPSAWRALEGARMTLDLRYTAAYRREQQALSQVRGAFYNVLLAKSQLEVLHKSIQRTTQTVEDATKLVERGVAPKMQRLTAEVELVNLETRRFQAQNGIELALNNLKFAIGIPLQTRIDLKGTLEGFLFGITEYEKFGLENAIETALKRRPDLQQAQAGIKLQSLQRDISNKSHLPNISAFANLGFTGNIPDNRTVSSNTTDNPFQYTTSRNRIWSSDYWNPTFSLGLRLNWRIYDGGIMHAQRQKTQIAVDRSELQAEQLRESIRLEVEAALRTLVNAKRRMDSMGVNINRAAENYEMAVSRLNEGVATPLEERNASELLDQTQLAYIQALYDYLIAQNSLETAMGVMPFESLE